MISTPWGKYSLNYTNILGISLIHVLSIGAFFCFSWANLTVCLVGIFLITPLGINVGYHRLLAHRSFESPNWLRHCLGFIGAMTGAGSPLFWVSMHRIHHRYSDTNSDPHNSRRGFLFSHIIHLLIESEHELDGDYLKKYVPDLLADPFLVKLNKYWIVLALGTIPLLYLAGGLGFVFWGAFLRVAITWHFMWFVNSASHMWGYRNYNTKDTAVNCWWVGLLAAGEGWHNNHHAYPSSAAHGHKWWELDQSYGIIRLFELLGWAKNVKRPPAWTKGPGCSLNQHDAEPG